MSTDSRSLTESLAAIFVAGLRQIDPREWRRQTINENEPVPPVDYFGPNAFERIPRTSQIGEVARLATNRVARLAFNSSEEVFSAALRFEQVVGAQRGLIEALLAYSITTSRTTCESFAEISGRITRDAQRGVLPNDNLFRGLRVAPLVWQTTPDTRPRHVNCRSSLDDVVVTEMWASDTGPLRRSVDHDAAYRGGGHAGIIVGHAMEEAAPGSAVSIYPLRDGHVGVDLASGPDRTVAYGLIDEAPGGAALITGREIVAAFEDSRGNRREVITAENYASVPHRPVTWERGLSHVDCGGVLMLGERHLRRTCGVCGRVWDEFEIAQARHLESIGVEWRDVLVDDTHARAADDARNRPPRNHRLPASLTGPRDQADRPEPLAPAPSFLPPQRPR